jgi:NTE family protein
VAGTRASIRAVIDGLTEHGFDVAAVAGSSMGALVRGLHAAEQLETFTGRVRGIGQR